MAWLHATPKPDARTKRAKHDDDKPKLSRIDTMRKAGVTPAMPPNPAPHIVSRLVEIGLNEAAGMGSAVPLSWGEIDAWCNRTKIDLEPWEGRLIRHLSREYVIEGRRAESENAPPPWHAPVTQREAKHEEDSLRMLLG